MTASYKLSIRKSAERELRKIPKRDLGPLVEKIHRLSANPRPQGCQKLSSADAYRIRHGDWRVVYAVDDESHEVTIDKIGNRREIYR